MTFVVPEHIGCRNQDIPHLRMPTSLVHAHTFPSSLVHAHTFLSRFVGTILGIWGFGFRGFWGFGVSGWGHDELETHWMLQPARTLLTCARLHHLYMLFLHHLYITCTHLPSRFVGYTGDLGFWCFRGFWVPGFRGGIMIYHDDIRSAWKHGMPQPGHSSLAHAFLTVYPCSFPFSLAHVHAFLAVRFGLLGFGGFGISG